MTPTTVRAPERDSQEHPTKSLDSEIKHEAALSMLTASNAIGLQQVQSRSHGTRLGRRPVLVRIGMPRLLDLAAPRLVRLSHACNSLPIRLDEVGTLFGHGVSTRHDICTLSATSTSGTSQLTS